MVPLRGHGNQPEPAAGSSFCPGGRPEKACGRLLLLRWRGPRGRRDSERGVRPRRHRASPHRGRMDSDQLAGQRRAFAHPFLAGASMSAANKSSFFRQSGWMVVATFVGGAFMTLVHTVARRMGPQDYSTFVTLL